MLELLKIKRDINWLIDQIKCLIRKSDLTSPLSATEWSANHEVSTGNPYIKDSFVWLDGDIYKSLVDNNIYPPTNITYWENLGTGHLLLEEQSDWDATTGRPLIKNKPTKTSDFINDGEDGAHPFITIEDAPTFIPSDYDLDEFTNNNVDPFAHVSDIPAPLGYTPVNKAGDTMLGNLVLNQDPTNALQAATKQYVDNIVSGINFHPPVIVATDVPLIATYDNGVGGVGATLTGPSVGVLMIDGENPTYLQRILVWQQTNPIENGIYDLTIVGDVTTVYQLTRTLDADNNPSGEIHYGDYTLVLSGDTNGGFGFICNTPGIISIGTTPINYIQFNAAQAVTAGYGLKEVTSNIIEIDSLVTQEKITLTVLGNSGASTLIGNTLNIPQYLSPALVFLDEGNGNGIVRTDRNPTFFGNIGEYAFDISWSNIVGNYGATGTSSFAHGDFLLSQGYGTFLIGENNVTGLSSVYTFQQGIYQNESGSTYANFFTGIGHSILGGAYCTVVGQFANEITNNIYDVNNGNNTMFAVGNGRATPAGTLQSRSTAFQIYKDGRVIASSLTSALITADITGKILINKEWALANLGGGGAITLSAIGSTPNANAATLTGNVLNLQPASASFGGVVTTGVQTFAGAKTFNDFVTAPSYSYTGGSIFPYNNDTIYTNATGRTHYFGGGPGNVQNNLAVPNGTFNIGLQTASTIASFDASKNVVSLPTATYPSLTELAYLKGVTSGIQTQLNSKANDSTVVHNTGTETIAGVKTFSSNPKIPVNFGNSGIGALVIENGVGQIEVATNYVYPNTTELTYVKGVTSTIQTQLNNKIAKNVGTTYTTNAITTVTAAEYAAIVTKDPNTLYFII